MSSGVKPATIRKRKSKPKNPPDPNQTVINWREDELNILIQNFGFSSDWGVQFPTANCTALDAPTGFMTLYADFFREGNFCLPMSKFIGEVLTGYGLHISQINALGLPRVTHFEIICRAQKIEPTFEKFNVFYYVTYTGGFYSFNSRTGGVLPCSRDPPKSLHDWKKSSYIYVAGLFQLTCTTGKKLEERALVAAGMSMLWVPQNPRAYPVYGHKGKGYSLMNVFNPKVAGGMVVAALPEGEPGWVARIRDNFLHPSNESMATYANTILGVVQRFYVSFYVLFKFLRVNTTQRACVS
ncbi:hypothetical protein Hanom_Chr12g01107281 [Helianthus anomalus]